MRRVSVTTVLLLSLLASCASLPTPTGRPELRVRLDPAATKSRIVADYTAAGWAVKDSDASGVTVTVEYDSKGRFLFGQGDFVTRFDLQAIDGGTQIRVRCRREGRFGGGDDVSGGGQGRETQRTLERLFDDVRIDGPYVMRFRE